MGRLEIASRVRRSLSRTRGTGTPGELGALQEQNVALQSVLDATDDGICMADRDGTLLFANRTMERMWRELELPAEGTIWQRLGALAQITVDPDAARAAAAGLADFDASVAADVELVNGRALHCFSAPVRDPGGRTFGRIFVLRDITKERGAERAKEDFVATISHELRTPLTAMVGYLELVLDGEAGELNENQARFLDIVSRNAMRLNRLVDDILFVARVDAGKLSLEIEEVALGPLVESEVEYNRAAADMKGVELVLELDDALPPLSGDPTRLAQCVSNLLTNAIKFTPAGGSVAVAVRRHGDNALVTIADSGVGVPEDEVDRLFDRFFRASTASVLPGTGLGLSIVKSIVEAHGGAVSVESEEGVGTTFTVELPIRTAPTARVGA